MIIAVDFDGTCVTHEYPKVGKDIGAVPVLKWLTDNGHQIILWTMRGSKSYTDKVPYLGDLLDAVSWFTNNDIPLFGVNSNPAQSTWTDSPKAYAHIYIDDAALGCPLVTDYRISNRPFVHWGRVKQILQDIFEGHTAIGHTALINAASTEESHENN
jgi:hypothetical protein